MATASEAKPKINTTQKFNNVYIKTMNTVTNTIYEVQKAVKINEKSSTAASKPSEAPDNGENQARGSNGGKQRSIQNAANAVLGRVKTVGRTAIMQMNQVTKQARGNADRPSKPLPKNGTATDTEPSTSKALALGQLKENAKSLANQLMQTARRLKTKSPEAI